MIRDIYINQHQTYTWSYAVTSTDDYTVGTFAGMIRPHHESTEVHPITVTVTNPTTHTIQLSMTATETATLTKQRYVYDVVHTNGTTKKRLLEGTVYVTPGITHA